MQVPSIARGFLYPNMLRNRCPKFSQCLLTSKCQNYDKHQRICALCETRVRPAVNLGGVLAEGEYQEDAQLAIKTIRDALNAPFADPNFDGGSSASVTMTDLQKMQDATRVLDAWNGKYTEEDVSVAVDHATAQQYRGLL